ncbi:MULTISPECIES: quorum-quenching N-acyl homoserine lactonase AiiA [Bacillus cereus group]|uniref:quorum-quenching N-acyl homoserine lactonase AiiA n=1 Tax=Bacillus cereus group TaxID=86661 RepID=UPI001F58D292|nr:MULTISPECIES: N-acyl homoserine lactonase family protein [Bacillus cereus group]MDA2310895.1 N-acyl homoserine lactonase family protein [Bacillus cereus]MDA2315627.1 N-acyl homoserine lactonase family protein [Bacillus cereus]MDA2499716.1 N-acyl homoserine lactonase family protein [Bacillus cereus]MDF9615720.1 N-acyl homoserine lactonase family protein [Bacillus cereus]
MTVKKLYFVPAGRCMLDHSSVNSTLAPGNLLNLPVWCYLLETAEGPILVDTGMPESAVNNEGLFNGTFVEGQILPKMTEEDRIVNILKRVGYEPDDLLYIISSHLHFDHAGGNGAFTNTPIIVQRTEYEAALHREEYMKECILPYLNYKIIEGDYEVVPGVQLLYTPGHSPGHQSLFIETEQSGSILLTIDASYTKENFEDEVPFAGFDSELALSSIKRLKEVVLKENPIVFFGHDIEQEKGCKVFPEYI